MTSHLSDCTNEYDYSTRLVFLADWFDNSTGNIMKFFLYFFPFDNSVEIWFRNKKQIFLRRCLCDGISFKDMFIGNTVRIYGRQITLKEYADERTKKIVSQKTEKTFAILKPTVLKEMGKIIRTISQNNLRLSRVKMCQLNGKEAIEFYENKKTDSFLPFLIDHIQSGPILAMVLVGENAIEKWRQLIGPTEPAEARKNAPNSLRAIYGLEKASNGFHGSNTPEEVDRASKFFFPIITDYKTGRSPLTTAKIKNCTCCVIKPHVIDDGLVGDILCDIIDQGFKINAVELFYLSNANADEFLEVYKGVVGDFNALHLSFIDGPCIVLEIGYPEGVDKDVHQEFRKFCGPSDPDVARQIRPHTLRAKYGKERFQNAVHCTDLPEDTQLELEYFFKLLEI